MQNPEVYSDRLRVRVNISHLYPMSHLPHQNKSQKEAWYTEDIPDLREPFRERTLALSEEWRKERAAREKAKEDQPDVTDDKQPEKVDKGKGKSIEAHVIDDLDDVVEVSDINLSGKPSVPKTRPKPRAKNKYGSLRR